MILTETHFGEMTAVALQAVWLQRAVPQGTTLFAKPVDWNISCDTELVVMDLHVHTAIL